jgi:hypothetical protein
MKRILLTALTLTALALSSHGQGTLTFNNSATTLVVYQLNYGSPDTAPLPVGSGYVEIFWAPLGHHGPAIVPAGSRRESAANYLCRPVGSPAARGPFPPVLGSPASPPVRPCRPISGDGPAPQTLGMMGVWGKWVTHLSSRLIPAIPPPLPVAPPGTLYAGGNNQTGNAFTGLTLSDHPRALQRSAAPAGLRRARLV